MLQSTSAMLILPGDLFGLLDILDLAEAGTHPSIRRDALFATSPDGIIVEFAPSKPYRQGRKSRGSSRSSRALDSDRKGTRRYSVASSTSSLSSCVSVDSDSDSGICASEVSSCSSVSPLSSSRTKTKKTKSNSVPISTSASLPLTSLAASKDDITSKRGRKFTYQSPNTSLLTTINTSHPENVPKEVASEAISALIGKLDDIMSMKRNVVLQRLKI